MPGRRDEVFASWKASVTELAKCPNVTMKLGGMMMRAALYDYKAAERPPSSEELAALWRPYMETCIELFGAKRCMFESNFPVEKMGIGWVGAVERVQADRRRRVGRREAGVVPRHGAADLSVGVRKP